MKRLCQALVAVAVLTAALVGGSPATSLAQGEATEPTPQPTTEPSPSAEPTEPTSEPSPSGDEGSTDESDAGENDSQDAEAGGGESAPSNGTTDDVAPASSSSAVDSNLVEEVVEAVGGAVEDPCAGQGLDCGIDMGNPCDPNRTGQTCMEYVADGSLRSSTTSGATHTTPARRARRTSSTRSGV